MKDDMISRQAAIDAFAPYAEYESNRTNAEWVRRINMVLSALPPAQPVCEDAVSRKSVVDILEQADPDLMAYLVNRLPSVLPPAQPVNIAKLQPNCNQVASDCASDCASHCVSDCISRQAAIELFKDDIAAVNELNNLPSLPDRMKYVQESVNTIMNTCKSDSIKDKAFRNAARMIQNAIDGEAPDYETIEELPPVQPGWIPVTERLPENEQDVFVTVEVRLYGRKPFRRVVKAFYTDGRHTDADSAYSWDEFPDPQYDDDDNLIIPEGWWESSDYLEQQGMIDDFVIAWREPLKPWEGGRDNG